MCHDIWKLILRTFPPHDSRTVARFAWLPTIMDNGSLVWLRRFKDVEVKARPESKWVNVAREF